VAGEVGVEGGDLLLADDPDLDEELADAPQEAAPKGSSAPSRRRRSRISLTSSSERWPHSTAIRPMDGRWRRCQATASTRFRHEARPE
jgi:hypothetical protein